MHRKPEPTAAAKMLTQAFAAQGIELKHQAALNLLATLEGFESYAHMKAAKAPETAPEVANPERYLAHILFSEEYVTQLNEARDKDDEEGVQAMLAEALTYEFDTAGELQAFLDGVDAGVGWMEFEDVTEEIKASRTAS